MSDTENSQQKDPERTPNTASTSPSVDPGLARYVELAVKDLGERLVLDRNQVEVLSAERKVWPNAALGCLRPGMQYIQVPVDGALIRLRVGKIIYRYHSGGSKTPFLCE